MDSNCDDVNYRTVTTNVVIGKHFEKEIKNVILGRSAKNYNNFSPTLIALERHRRGLTAEQVSKMTGRSLKLEEDNLRRIYEAGLIKKRESKFFYTNRTREDIRKVFGTDVILLSANYLTEKQIEIEGKLLSD